MNPIVDKPQEFTKYDRQGAYHWHQMRRSIKRHNAGLAARYEICLDLLKDHAPASVRNILDIGCGDGYFTCRLAELFPEAEVFGYDFAERGIQYARSLCPRKNVHFQLGDAFASTNEHDMVVATDVIEHVSDQFGFCSRMRDITRPGGICVISTPVRIKEIPDDPFHYRELFPGELKDLLEKAGLNIVATRFSHDYCVLSAYGKRFSLFGLGRMRLKKYWYNTLALMGLNPFSRPFSTLPTMQYVVCTRRHP